MSELKNYAELSFINPILIDVLGHHISNSVLASFVSEKGVVRLKFRITPGTVAPTNCEQVISLLFALIESNPESPLGAAYAEKRADILSETVLRLSHVLDGFGKVKIDLHTTEKSPAAPYTEVQKHTEFTLEREKTTENHNNP